MTDKITEVVAQSFGGMTNQEYLELVSNAARPIKNTKSFDCDVSLHNWSVVDAKERLETLVGLAKTAISGIEAAGYVIVPKEPTEDK
jgi:hypothetical protein